MHKKSPFAPIVALGLGAVAMLAAATASAAEPVTLDDKGTAAEAGIMKWKDGKKAVFMLEFDDSCVSHVKTAIPELVKRGMVGTFYINPGNGPYQNEKSAWENDIPKTGMEYGNHTFKHKGAPSVEVLDEELALCSDVINKCFPDRKQPRLVSFGQPGGVPWTITDEEKNQLLKKYNLVQRPSFFGYPFHAKTKEDVLKLVDDAIAKGDMGHHDFHGVGGDWLITPTDIFLALLDKLDACKDVVWVTDPVSYHKYLTERKAAELKLAGKANDKITLQLTCTTDPALYDLPLTLYVRVPPQWKAFSVTQGKDKLVSQLSDGMLRFAASPVTGEITVRRMAN